MESGGPRISTLIPMYLTCAYLAYHTPLHGFNRFTAIGTYCEYLPYPAKVNAPILTPV